MKNLSIAFRIKKRMEMMKLIPMSNWITICRQTKTSTTFFQVQASVRRNSRVNPRPTKSSTWNSCWQYCVSRPTISRVTWPQRRFPQPLRCWLPSWTLLQRSSLTVGSSWTRRENSCSTRTASCCMRLPCGDQSSTYSSSTS